jgi:hypothetical protein
VADTLAGSGRYALLPIIATATTGHLGGRHSEWVVFSFLFGNVKLRISILE